MAKRNKRIQNIVETLLSKLDKFALPINVRAIAENENIVINEDGAMGDISGLIYRDGTTVTIGVNKKDSPRRKRFTIAHELGHYFLHSESPLFIDKVFAVRLRDHVSSEAVSIEEIEANAFAAELLMPTSVILDDIKNSTNIFDYEKDGLSKLIKELANKYEVSDQAMNIRLINLGIIQGGI